MILNAIQFAVVFYDQGAIYLYTKSMVGPLCEKVETDKIEISKKRNSKIWQLRDKGNWKPYFGQKHVGMKTKITLKN
jgi:hypothetical protein